MQLLGQVVYANKASTSDDASISVIPPSPEAYGPLPVIIQNTPTLDGKRNTRKAFRQRLRLIV